MAFMIEEIATVKSIIAILREISKDYIYSKNATLEDDFYKRSLSLEISKNIQILDRVDFDNFEFSDTNAMSKLLKILDFKFLEAVAKNLKNIDLLHDTLNDELEPSDKNVHELIYYVITRFYLLENYQSISQLKGIKNINAKLLLTRIKNSLLLINKILKQ
jgi:hypothetical protein